MASSSGEGKVAAHFTEVVSSSAEKELAIDEHASTVGLAPNVCVVPELSVVVQEGEECVQDFLDHLSGKKSAARHFVLGGEADDSDSFVDIMSGISAVSDAESEAGTVTDALALAKISVETWAEGVVHNSFACMLVFFLLSPLAFSR